MADQARFVIDGREYDVPETDSLTMGEAVVVYDYTGLGLDQIGGGVNHPGVLLAFAHIAYKRGNPSLSNEEIRELIEGTKLIDALSGIDGEDDAGPPDMTPSPPSSSDSDGSSGSTSSTSSDEPDDPPSPTGTSA